MSSSGAVTSVPAAVTTRTRPAFSATNVRPSGAQSTAVGAVSPETTVRSSYPAGSVAATATGTPIGVAIHATRRAIPANPNAAAALASESRIESHGSQSAAMVPPNLRRRSGDAVHRDDVQVIGRPGCLQPLRAAEPEAIERQLPAGRLRHEHLTRSGRFHHARRDVHVDAEVVAPQSAWLS